MLGPTTNKWPGSPGRDPGLIRLLSKAFCGLLKEQDFINLQEILRTTNAMDYIRPFICVAPPFTLGVYWKFEFKTFSKDEKRCDRTNHRTYK